MIHNEEEALLGVITSIATATLPFSYKCQIVAINDGSSDTSQRILETASQTFPVHTIAYKERRGMPASFTGAFHHLSTILTDDDLVFTLEADGTNDSACLLPMIQKIHEGADVVIASRYAPGAVSVGFPQHRLWGSAVVNLFLGLLWGIPRVRDHSVLYRVYRGAPLRAYIADAVPFRARRSFAVISEILLHMSRYTEKFAEVPLRYDYALKRGPSKMNLPQTLFEYTRITPPTVLGQRILRLIGVKK